MQHGTKSVVARDDVTPLEWSWMLGVSSVTGLVLLRFKRWEGWLVTLLGEIGWIWYSFLPGHLGFLPASIAYAGVSIEALYAWRKQERSLEEGGKRAG